MAHETESGVVCEPRALNPHFQCPPSCRLLDRLLFQLPRRPWLSVGSYGELRMSRALVMHTSLKHSSGERCENI